MKKEEVKKKRRMKKRKRSKVRCNNQFLGVGITAFVFWIAC